MVETIQLSEFRRAKLQPPEHDGAGVYAWIERLRALRIDLEGGGVVGEEAADRLARKYRHAYDVNPPTSRYELIHYYMYLVVIAQDIIADIKAQHPNTQGLDDLVFGMFPHTYPNAVVLALPDARMALLFNFATFSLAFGVARFLATYGELSIGSGGEHALDLRLATLVKNATSAPEELKHLTETLKAVLFGSTEKLDVDLQPPPMPNGRIYQSLLSGMIRFIVCHELAHVVARHHKTPRLHQRLGALLTYGMKTGMVTKFQELEADSIGLRLSFSAHRRMALAGGVVDAGRINASAILEAYTGANMILSMFGILEKVAQSHVGIEDPEELQSSTHPTITERRRWLYEEALRISPPMKEFFATADETSSSAITFVASALQSRLDLPGVAGRPLSPMWSQRLAEAGLLRDANGRSKDKAPNGRS